jgi:hypothetical protein
MCWAKNSDKSQNQNSPARQIFLIIFIDGAKRRTEIEFGFEFQI